MSGCKGSSLAQYSIIIALIAMALAAGFFIIGNNITSQFVHFSQVFSDNNFENKQINSTPNTKETLQEFPAGSLGGTPAKPVKKCRNDTCVVDYGDFVLQGIPDNFVDRVHSSGASGGTDSLLSILDQLIAQLEQNKTTEELKNVKDLSNLGHILSAFEKDLESYSANCASSTNPQTCMSDIFKQSYNPPDSLASLYPDINLNQNNYSHTDIGSAVDFFNNDKTYFEARKDSYLPFAIVDKYHQTMSDPNLTDPQKGVIQELYWQISALGSEMDDTLYAAKQSSDWSYTYYDAITGEPEPTVLQNINIDSILNPQYSHITDLDSALICGAGYKSDINSKCH